MFWRTRQLFVGDLEIGDFVLRQLSSFRSSLLIGAGASLMASGVCGLNGVRSRNRRIVSGEL